MRKTLGLVMLFVLLVTGTAYAAPATPDKKTVEKMKRCLMAAQEAYAEMVRENATGSRKVEGCGTVSRTVETQTVGDSFTKCEIRGDSDFWYSYEVETCVSWSDNNEAEIHWYQNPPTVTIGHTPSAVRVVHVTKHSGLHDAYSGFAYSGVQLELWSPIFFAWFKFADVFVETTVNFP
ncbi:MAG: hypothetical protein ACOY94_16085 [Bacillota bacterium]